MFEGVLQKARTVLVDRYNQRRWIFTFEPMIADRVGTAASASTAITFAWCYCLYSVCLWCASATVRPMALDLCVPCACAIFDPCQAESFRTVRTFINSTACRSSFTLSGPPRVLRSKECLCTSRRSLFILAPRRIVSGQFNHVAQPSIAAFRL